MNRTFRFSLVVVGVLALALTAAFFFQLPLALRLWPLPASRLSNIFIASILAAAACPVIWIGLSGEGRAMAGGGINFGVTYLGIGIFALQLYGRDRQAGMLVFGLLALGLALVCFLILAYSWRIPFQDKRPTPLPVRISFGIFAVVLLVVGGSLALQRPNIFPWPLSPETSTIYGWIFLGAMCYFIYALIFPLWGNACGQLLGFLAYDLVLIQPFLAHFQTVKPELRDNLIVYTGVLIYSGLLAVYYLFVNPSTRFRLSRGSEAAQPARV